MFRSLIAALLVCATFSGANAQSVAPIDTLFRALGLPEIIDIMRKEGMGYGEDLQRDLFGGRQPPAWNDVVSDIYDFDRMQDTVRNRMDSELAASDLAPLISYFMSDTGREIVDLEVSARRALLDDAVEEASRASLEAMIERADPRLKLLEEFAEVSELVDANVVGAMNANYAFFLGLAQGGVTDGMTEAEILADVWTQEPMIRLDTEEWLFAYLALAYQPLSDEHLQGYTDFLATEAGQRLNRAVFAAFDEMFVAISLALGQGAAQFMGGQEL